MSLTSDRGQGFFMPPEWAPQEAVWLSWPVDDPRHWGGAKRELIWEKFAEITALISRYEDVRINAVDRLPEWLPPRIDALGGDCERVRLFDHPHNDVWCRDHGPIFVRHTKRKEVAVTDWGFNGWGGRFAPWDLDDTIPRQVADALRMRRFEGGMILEGGAIEVNGVGDLLTTEAVLLNPNRNPDLGREAIASRLRLSLGVSNILWLERGIEGDDTGGHIDDLARFVNDGTIVAGVERDAASPNHAVLSRNLARLREFQSADGSLFEIVEIPMPRACALPGWRLPVLPASYLNFLLLNGAVLVPTFRQTHNDDRALGTLRDLFPDRQIVGVDSLDLVEEGGCLHCITQQQPAA